mgnify:CR=1 FL=1
MLKPLRRDEDEVIGIGVVVGPKQSGFAAQAQPFPYFVFYVQVNALEIGIGLCIAEGWERPTDGKGWGQLGPSINVVVEIGVKFNASRKSGRLAIRIECISKSCKRARDR